MRGQLVAHPSPVAQACGLAALDTVMNRVERQDGVRQHVCLDAQVLSPYFLVSGREFFGPESQATETSGLSNAPIKRHLSSRDARLILQGDPLITTMLNEQGTGCVAIVADMMIGRHRRLQLVV